MTSKEIVLHALHFEPVPRIPVAVLDGYVWMLKRNGLSFKDLFESEDNGAALVIRTFDELQSDIVCPNFHVFNFIFEAMGAVLSYDKPGEAFEITKPAMTETTEIDRYDANQIMECMLKLPGIQSGLKLIERLREHYGETKLIPALGAAPLTFAGMMMGVQNFMEQLYDDEGATARILDFSVEMVARQLEEQLKHGADSVLIADPVASGDMISPAAFEELSLPYLKKLTKRLEQYHVPILLHICGNTLPRLPVLKQAGIQGFSLDSVDLKTALNEAYGSYCIMGNMNPYKVMQCMSEQEVYEHCLDLAQTAGMNGGYIMMPGCDLSPAIPLENIQSMVRAAYAVHE